MTDSQGLDNTLFGLNDIAGNSSLNLLFRGIRVLDLCHDLWYLSPFICCFLLDKENKNVTSFYPCAWAHIRFYISALELLSLCVMLINSISLRICLVLCSVWTVYRIWETAICQHTHPSSIIQHLSTLHDDSIYKVAQSWWRKANNVAIPEYNSGSNRVLFSLSCFCCLWWRHYFSGVRSSCLRPPGLLGRRFFLTWRSLMWWKCMEGFQIGRWEPIGGKWLSVDVCVCLCLSRQFPT